MNSLNGRRVALLEARRASELAGLIGRMGGDVLCAPALREVGGDAAPAARALLDGMKAGAIDVVVLLTGVAVDRLLDGAAALGRQAEMLAGLAAATLVCRGPKPLAALRRHGLQAPGTHLWVTAPSPYTTADLLGALDAMDLDGCGVALLHYGERNGELADYLRGRGALVRELSVYEWQLPADHTPLVEMVRAITAGQVDALAVTSQIQIRHLLQIADLLGRRAALIAALNEIAVAAVGPTCAAALREAGIAVAVVPENPFMGQMVKELAAYLSPVLQA